MTLFSNKKKVVNREVIRKTMYVDIVSLEPRSIKTSIVKLGCWSVGPLGKMMQKVHPSETVFNKKFIQFSV